MKILKSISYLIILSVISIPLVSAVNDSPALENFRTMYSITSPSLEVAKELTLELPNNHERGYVIVEDQTGKAQSVQAYSINELSLEVADHSSLRKQPSNLVDNNRSSSAEFDIDEDNGKAFLVIDADRLLTTSEFRFELAANVTMPTHFALYAYKDNSWTTLVAQKELNSRFITFPVTSAKKWKIEFWHDQPLIMTEVSFIDKRVNENLGVIWLGRPNETYTLYTNAAVNSPADGIILRERGILILNPALDAELGTPIKNPNFQEPDTDEDGVINSEDNCLTVANADQVDIDNNNIGDACEDNDNDRVINSEDNCPEHSNRRQLDNDGDGIGDECDDEESRLTENLPWLPWIGMLAAALMVLYIAVSTIRKK